MEYKYTYICTECGAIRVLSFETQDGRAPAPYDVPNKLTCHAGDCEEPMRRKYQ